MIEEPTAEKPPVKTLHDNFCMKVRALLAVSSSLPG
jgi:hypothetical protein